MKRDLGRIVAAVLAGILAFALAPHPQRAQAAVGVSLYSLHNVAPVGRTVTATVQVSPALPQVLVEAYVTGHALPVDANKTDANGRTTVNLDYEIMLAKTHKYEIRAWIGGTLSTLKDIPVTRTPRVTLLAAPGIAAPGQQVTARYEVVGGTVGSVGFVDAWVYPNWSRSQQVTMTSAYQFTVKLTYGQNTPGTYAFRGGATVNGITGYARQFEMTRASLRLWSAPPTLHVGTTGTATGKVAAPPISPNIGYLQVWHGEKFVTIRQATINSSGYFTVPLAYGVNTPGRYTFRLWYFVNDFDLYVTFVVDRI